MQQSLMTMPDYYNTHYIQYHDKTFHIDPSPFLSSFIKRLKPGAHVLDIGCGSGRDLLWLSQKGFHATGFEASPGLASLARENANCTVIEGNFETFDFLGLNADALLLSGALVHLPHDRMAPVLKNILQALTTSPGALVYLSLKEGDDIYTDAHNRTFHPWHDSGIQPVFYRTGLRVIEFTRTSSVLGTGENWLGYVLERETAGRQDAV